MKKPILLKIDIILALQLPQVTNYTNNSTVCTCVTMEKQFMPDEVLFALFKLIPPLETGRIFNFKNRTHDTIITQY